MYTYKKRGQVKSEFEYTVTWQAAALSPRRTFNRPAVFFRHLGLIALLCREENMRYVFKNIISTFLIF